MTITDQVIHEIEVFLVRWQMPPSVFGLQSCGDKHLVRRLRAGKSITLRRADQIRAFMAAYRPADARGPKRRRKAPKGEARAA